MTEYIIQLTYLTDGSATVHDFTLRLYAFDINSAILMGVSKAVAMFAGTNQKLRTVGAQEA